MNLDIKKRKKTNSLIKPPDFAPSLAAVIVAHLSVTFFAFDPIHPAKKAKPGGASLIGYKIAFTPKDDPEPAPETFVVQVPEGKTIFEVIYGLGKVGERMWIMAWYMSPTGKPSPVSVVISVLLV